MLLLDVALLQLNLNLRELFSVELKNLLVLFILLLAESESLLSLLEFFSQHGKLILEVFVGLLSVFYVALTSKLSMSMSLV